MALFMVLTAILSSATCQDVPEPVGLFPFNSLYTTKDISNSYLITGTSVGLSLAPGPDGKPGGSYYFQGNSTSYIEIPRQTQLDTRYSLTVLAWIYNQGTDGPIIVYETGTNQWATHVFITKNAGNATTFFSKVVKRNDFAQFADPLQFDFRTTNTWRYVGYTYDYSTGYQALYVDGIKVREGNAVTKEEIATNYKIKIGGVTSFDSRAFRGRISCVQIYDKALTPEQVQAVKHLCVEKNVYSACFQYKFIDDPTRRLEHRSTSQPSDRQMFIRRRWYRLKPGKAETRITTSCPASGSCGAQSPGWLNGQYPSLEAGIQRMEICYRTGSDCCASNATVYVRQCYGYPVFRLDDVPDISLGNRICTETAPKMIFPNVMFKSTNDRCLSGHVMHSEVRVTEAAVCVGYCLTAGDKCKSCNFIKMLN